MTDSKAPLIEARVVSRQFVKPLDFAGKIARKLGSKVGGEVVHAVDRVDLSVYQGEVVGLVGESGCGKSTLGRMMDGILKPSSGSILYQGRELGRMNREEFQKASLKVQMIFQDPFASLNPRHRIRTIIGEAPLSHAIVPKKRIDDYVDEVMLRVGLDPTCKDRYPHQFSGGQRQRIGIARALAVQPEFIICDESVAALDVSIQAQILNLFMQLRSDLNLTYLFISHDISVVEHISDRIAVMYLGRIVETGNTEQLFEQPNHPYTQALLREVPRLENRHHSFKPVEGEIPSPIDPPTGCHFHPRCPMVMAQCRNEAPALLPVAHKHLSACHLNKF